MSFPNNSRRIENYQEVRNLLTSGEDMSEATKQKYNKRKATLGCIGCFPLALLEVAKVSEFGCKKHEVKLGDMGYLDLDDASNRYREAEVRHLLAEFTDGPINSQDGGLFHKAQKAWNALADLEVFLRQQKDN